MNWLQRMGRVVVESLEGGVLLDEECHFGQALKFIDSSHFKFVLSASTVYA